MSRKKTVHHEKQPLAPKAVRYAEDLKFKSCGNPECKVDHSTEGVMIHGACHPDDPLLAYFNPKDDTVEIGCATCRRMICCLKVQSKVTGGFAE